MRAVGLDVDHLTIMRTATEAASPSDGSIPCVESLGRAGRELAGADATRITQEDIDSMLWTADQPL